MPANQILIVEPFYSQTQQLQQNERLASISINLNKYIITLSMRKILEFCKFPAHIINTLAPYTFEDVKLAIIHCNFQSLNHILSEGFKSNDEDQGLLIFALTEGKEDVVIFLVENFQHLLDFKKRNDKGDSPLVLAIFRKLHRAIDMLIPICKIHICDFRRNTPFMIAAANGDIETLISLKRHDQCNTSTKNIDGQSALHRACYFGQLKIVDWLLQNTDLKIGESDNRGCNSLHLACEGLNINLTRYIMKKVKNSQKLLTANKQGKTPLDILKGLIGQVAPSQFKRLDLRHLEQDQNLF